MGSAPSLCIPATRHTSSSKSHYNGKNFPDLTALPPLKHKPVLPAEIELLEKHIQANSDRLRRVFGPVEGEGHIDSLMDDVRSLQIQTPRKCPWDTALYTQGSTVQHTLDSDDASDTEEDDLSAMVETSYMRATRAAVGPMEDAAYNVGNFVAVKADDTDAGSMVHFWVGKILQRPFKLDKSVVMQVQWYEPQSGKQYTDWLFPCQHTVQKKRVPWTDNIDVCSVLAHFEVTRGSDAFREAIKMPRSRSVHTQLANG